MYETEAVPKHELWSLGGQVDVQAPPLGCVVVVVVGGTVEVVVVVGGIVVVVGGTVVVVGGTVVVVVFVAQDNVAGLLDPAKASPVVQFVMVVL
jgi:hypothetical protein